MRMMPKKAVWILSALLCGSFGVMAGGVPKELPDPDGKPANMKKPVHVFILLGQSNMLGFGRLSGLKAATGKGLYPYLVDGDGNWTVRKDVRNVRLSWAGATNFGTHVNDWMSPANGISDKHPQIGPEMGIGYYVGEVLDAPVLILKICTGNRSLGYDLLPPSANGYQGDPALKPRRVRDLKPGEKWYGGIQYDGDVGCALKALQNIGTYYPGATKFEIGGFCFWQGAKDCGRGGNANDYEKNLVELIKSLRKDFNAPNAPFVCATMGNGKKGGGGAAGKVTDAQLAVDGRTGKYPEYKNTVRTFYSNPVSKGGGANGHYGGNAETYMNVGAGMGRLMAELLVANAAKRPKAGKGRPRSARDLPKGNVQALQLILQKSLAELSADGKLKKIKIKMKGTRREVYLKAADENGNLTYRMLNSKKTAKFQLQKLTAWDHAYLARLVTKLEPESSDAKAMAGVFFENAGSTKMADEFYNEAGESSTRKFEKLFK